MMPSPIKKLIIAGGGTAGWMTAAAISKALGDTVEILLIESDSIATVGVGEATIPPIRGFVEHLGIDEREFIINTEATFKLGIDFRDWGHKGHRYFHAFGDYGGSFEGITDYHLWRRLRTEGDPTPLEAYSLPAQLALQNRFIPPSPDSRSTLRDYTYAYQFDAAAFARCLRTYAEARGVRRLNARINDVRLRADNSFIDALVLDDGLIESADFFVDCTGFRGLLIEGALRTGFTDWGHWLPVDRAWAGQTERVDPLTPYTRATAHKAGWQWRIPLQHRIGTGHVFASDFISEDEALQTFHATLETPQVIDPHLIRFKTGHRRQFWNKNCAAIGLSAGFLEPLESTSINFIQMGIARLLDQFPSKACESILAREYNRQMILNFERVRDFIILHYHLSQRSDSDMWHHVRHMALPDSLQHRLDVFRLRGNLVSHEEDQFAPPSWLAIYDGMGVISQQHDPLTSRLNMAQLRHLMQKRLDNINRVVPQVPLQQDFIAQHCASPRRLVVS